MRRLHRTSSLKSSMRVTRGARPALVFPLDFYDILGHENDTRGSFRADSEGLPSSKRIERTDASQLTVFNASKTTDYLQSM